MPVHRQTPLPHDQSTLIEKFYPKDREWFSREPYIYEPPPEPDHHAPPSLNRDAPAEYFYPQDREGYGEDPALTEIINVRLDEVLPDIYAPDLQDPYEHRRYRDINGRTTEQAAAYEDFVVSVKNGLMIGALFYACFVILYFLNTLN